MIGKPTIERLKDWARSVKRDVIALWLAARDPRVPWYAKAIAAVVAAYALSPIDLIPDFVPVLGYLDDLLIVPLGILLAVKLIPEPVMMDLRAKSLEQRKPTSKGGLVAIVLIWLAAIALAIWLVWPIGANGGG
ncbi:YkvA family protein [Sphingomonas sp. LaA6.9]|uniref:YkvA family protein n=1 Tax=Sphingomonas sp. LaA6.9 TaxID=2919914 RepID=UPI00387E4EEB